VHFERNGATRFASQWLTAAKNRGALAILLALVPFSMGATFLPPVASPPRWDSHWLVANEEAALYAGATSDHVLGGVPPGTFYRVDAPALHGRAWVYNPLTEGWAWLPLEGTSMVGEPNVDEINSFFVPPSSPTPNAYLYASYPDIAERLDCVVWYESRWEPNARNPYSGASGLGQFMLSTWRRTPQGQAGLSPFDPYANIDAMAWMVYGGGSWREWEVVLRGLC
jgi:hypothetical protein